MTQTNHFLQFTALLVTLAAFALILSSQTYQQRPRFKDAPAPVTAQHGPEVSAARGQRPSLRGAINPLDISTSRARN